MPAKCLNKNGVCERFCRSRDDFRAGRTAPEQRGSIDSLASRTIQSNRSQLNKTPENISPKTRAWGLLPHLKLQNKSTPTDPAKNPLTALNIHPSNYVQSGDSTISKAFGRLLGAAADKKLQPHKNTRARVPCKRSAEPLLKLFVTLRGPSGNTSRARSQPQTGPVNNSTKLTFSCLS